MIRLVQLQGPGGRRLALVEELRLVLLDGSFSIYELAQACVEQKCTAYEILESLPGKTRIDYDAAYAGASPWKILPSARTTRSRLLWALGNFSRFLRPGMRRVELEGSGHDVRGLMGSAYKDEKTRRVTAVYINMGTDPQAGHRPHRSIRGAASDRARIDEERGGVFQAARRHDRQ
jgi:hypothetical protein